MSEDEKEVYEIIAGLPIDTKKVEILKDITVEAQLLMKSKFVKKVTVTFEDFRKINELGKDKEILLTTNLEGKRFIVYIDHGKIISSAVSDPRMNQRIVGLRPLATLIMASKIKPIVFKLFEVQKEIMEDKTRETPSRFYVALPVKEKVSEKQEAKPARISKEEKPPVILEFTKKIKEFMKRIKSELSEVAPYYGCKAVDLKIELSRGVLTVKVIVTKKGFLSKCRKDKLEDVLAGDTDLILSMLDLDLPYNVIVEEEKK